MTLQEELGRAVEWLVERNVVIPEKTLVRLVKQGVSLRSIVKSQDYYGAQITRLVTSLYNRNIDELEFVQVFQDLIDGQMRAAWLEGMARNNLSESDMTPEMQAELDGIVNDEHSEILSYAEDIIAAEGQDHLNGTNSLDSLLNRADLWQQRYADTVNQAVLFTADDSVHLVWLLGATEKHCKTCAALDNVVATAAQWQASGYHPQDPPNDQLECEGWRCDCRLDVTDAPLTEGGIPNV